MRDESSSALYTCQFEVERLVEAKAITPEAAVGIGDRDSQRPIAGAKE
jgi:hypothetical protein